MIMTDKAEIRREAKERQGTIVVSQRTRYLIDGDQKRARFQTGAEGVVQPAIELGTEKKYRIKVFWQPDSVRMARSRALVNRALATPRDSLDVLGGAPFDILDSLGGSSRFAVIMKNVDGVSWKDLRRDAEFAGVYPPDDWPSFRTRWLWAYGLASAVTRMEALNFIHADLSDGNIVAVHSGDRAGELALVDFDAYFNSEYPSNYLGTSGFVAPEIWTEGSIGVGSDRLAMAILIQEFLLVGDPELSATDAFQVRYTQEQICALECAAHPLIRLKYPAIADLFDKTLKAPSRDQRPTPMEWRDALRSLRRPPGTRVFHLAPLTGHPDLRIELRPGESKDLAPTDFGIRADIVLRETLRVRPHPGSRVLLRPVDGTWQELTDSSDVEISQNSRIFDRAGKMQAQVVMDPSPGDIAEPESRINLDSYDQKSADTPPRPPRPRKDPSQNDWEKIVLFAAIICAVLALVLAVLDYKRRHIAVISPGTGQPHTAQTVPNIAGSQSAQPPPAIVAAPQQMSDSNPTPVEEVNTTPPQNSAPAAAVHSSTEPAREPNAVRTELPDPIVDVAPSPATPEASPAAADSDRPQHENATSQQEPPKATVVPNVYRGPPSGDFVWSGAVEKDQLIEIANGAPSIGSINGQPLPGVPVSISIDNRQIAVVVQPNPLNHFSTVTFRSTTKGKIAFGVHWLVLPVN
jgi:serine/threonine protein kinase